MSLDAIYHLGRAIKKLPSVNTIYSTAEWDLSFRHKPDESGQK
jgi:hypothetical protein